MLGWLTASTRLKVTLNWVEEITDKQPGDI